MVFYAPLYYCIVHEMAFSKRISLSSAKNKSMKWRTWIKHLTDFQHIWQVDARDIKVNVFLLVWTIFFIIKFHRKFSNFFFLETKEMFILFHNFLFLFNFIVCMGISKKNEKNMRRKKVFYVCYVRLEILSRFQYFILWKWYNILDYTSLQLQFLSGQILMKFQIWKTSFSPIFNPISIASKIYEKLD